MRTKAAVTILLFCLSSFASAAKKLILPWPPEKPVIQATFGQFLLFAMGTGKSNTYLVDVEIENISNTQFPATVLSLVFNDASGAIIGNATLPVMQKLEPKQKLKQEITFVTVGKPALVTLASKEISMSRDRSIIAHTVSMTFRSIPTGANIEIDGQKAGITPKQLRVPVGSHLLILTKAGFNKAEYPFEIGAEDANGGAIEVELPSTNDIVEMRDGTVVAGDVESITWDKVRVIVSGKPVDCVRNDIKRILLVQRQSPSPATEAPPTAVEAK